MRVVLAELLAAKSQTPNCHHVALRVMQTEDRGDVQQFEIIYTSGWNMGSRSPPALILTKVRARMECSAGGKHQP
jgi:hypothetical protein